MGTTTPDAESVQGPLNQAAATDRIKFFRRPSYLLLTTAGTIIISEILIMTVIKYLPPMGDLPEALLDGVLLSFIVFPTLYFLFFKLLNQHIAQQRKTEEELREANQFSEQVIRSAQEGVIVYDLNLRYQVWNPFMEQIFGLPAAEVLGRQPAELFPFLQESGMMDRLQRVLAGEELAWLDFPYTVPETGRSGWVSDVSAPLLNTKGDVIGVIANVREISLNKQLENELREALKTTQAANDTMSRLLRTVAHEFRTPLGLLIGSTDILDRYWSRLTDEKRFEQNEHIRSAAQQMSNLINSVIAFNQLGMEIAGNTPTLLDVAKICRTIVAEVEAVWSSGQQCKVTIDTNGGTALLDEILFRRILENLLTNAFRYTPASGAVSLRVRLESRHLYLEISDTGIGIPQEDQKLIFEAFYRSGNIEGRRGLGLGLSIVQEALSQMSGTITVNSSIGEGTTMKVTIPIVNPV